MSNIIKFPAPDRRSDEQKYNDELEAQTGHRNDLGVIPCLYCDDPYCDFDCDEAQAAGFDIDEWNGT